MEEKQVKVVVKTLNTGAAKPIAVTSEEALRIAQAQNANNHVADITIEEKKNIDEVIEEANQVQPVEVKVLDANTYNQEVNLEKLNEVNDIVKIKTVKKDNPKTVMILVIILVIIILGFFIFELPYLIDLLKK
jgi:hypothetical protein